MEPGRLRHWLTFQQPTTTQDSDGNSVEDWTAAFAVNTRMPCEIVDLSGRELLAASAVQSQVTCRIRTRYRPGFSAKLRAVADDGTVYNLEGPIADPDSRRHGVTFNATTGVTEG